MFVKKEKEKKTEEERKRSLPGWGRERFGQACAVAARGALQAACAASIKNELLIRAQGQTMFSRALSMQRRTSSAAWGVMMASALSVGRTKFMLPISRSSVSRSGKERLEKP